MSNIKEYTKNFNFIIPNFNVATWHDEIADNLKAIDALIANFVQSQQYKGKWKNVTSYTVNDLVYIDDENSEYYGGLFRILVAHTTTADDFDTFLHNNPTYYELQGEMGAQVAARIAQDWATKLDGKVVVNDVPIEYSSKAYAIGGVGTETNNAKYFKDQTKILHDDLLSDPKIVAISNDLINDHYIQTAATHISDIIAVTDIESYVIAVSNIASDVTAVAEVAASVSIVADNIANINAVKNNATNINTVASNIAKVNTVSASIANVNTVADNIAKISTVYSNISAINNCSTNMTAIQNAPTAATNAANSATESRVWATGDDDAVADYELGEHSSHTYASLAMAIANTPEDTPVIAGIDAVDVIRGPRGYPGSSAPDGGTTGQVLTKRSNADGDTYWADSQGGGGGGGAGMNVDGGDAYSIYTAPQVIDGGSA